MSKTERVREELFGPFDESYFQAKMNKWWRLVAVHWERDVPGEATEQAAWIEEVPYGLRVADDCIHLEGVHASNFGRPKTVSRGRR